MFNEQPHGGTGNILRNQKGCAAHFEKFAPKVHYYHCALYDLNPAILITDDMLDTKCMLDTINSVIIFLNIIQKDKSFLENVLKKGKGMQLKKVCRKYVFFLKNNS